MENKVVIEQLPFKDNYKEQSIILETPSLQEYLSQGWQIKQIQFNVVNLHNTLPSDLVVSAWLQKTTDAE